jgi:type II secretory pathway pseudopilin PulG
MTLLEVLVALVILAMGLSAILQTVGTSARAQQRAALTATAVSIAEAMLSAPLELRDGGGTSTGRVGPWRWRRIATPLSTPATQPPGPLVAIQVDVTVSGPARIAVSLSTLVTAPRGRFP